MADATGCADRASTAAASRMHVGATARPTTATSVTFSSPFVSVPVLSNATIRIDGEALQVGAALDQHAVTGGHR